MKENAIRFTAYLSPPQENVYPDLVNPNCITEEHYRNLRDCGFTHAIGLFEDRERYYRQAMSMAERFGVTYYVRDQFPENSLEWIVDGAGGGSPEEALARLTPALAARFDGYLRYPAFTGILASDEPCRRKFEAIAAVQDWFRSRYPEKEFEVNLLPNYANAEQLSGEPDTAYSYEQYLSDYLRIVRPPMLSFDFYALEKDKEGRPSIRPGHLRNLELIAGAARRAGVPFYVFLLTIGHWGFRTVETYAEVAWQIYTALAYGAAGCQTFTYWTLLGDHSADGSGITHGVVGQNGELTPTYFALREAIAEVRAFEGEYLSLSWQGAFGASGRAGEPDPLLAALKEQTAPPLWLRALTTSENLVVGRFEGRGRAALLLANLSDPAFGRTAEIAVRLSAKRATLYVAGKKTDLRTDGEARFAVRSGGGAFLVVEL